jgi:hypothetical protein
MTLRVRYYFKLWYGLIAYLASLAGTLLLPNELVRPWAVLLLIVAAVLAVIAWRRQEWVPAFPRYPISHLTNLNRKPFFLSARSGGCASNWAHGQPSLPRRSKRDFWVSRCSVVGKYRLVAVLYFPSDAIGSG